MLSPLKNNHQGLKGFLMLPALSEPFPICYFIYLHNALQESTNSKLYLKSRVRSVCACVCVHARICTRASFGFLCGHECVFGHEHVCVLLFLGSRVYSV